MGSALLSLLGAGACAEPSDDFYDTGDSDRADTSSGMRVDFVPAMEWEYTPEIAEQRWHTEVRSVSEDTISVEGDLLWIDVEQARRLRVATASAADDAGAEANSDSASMVFQVLVEYGPQEDSPLRMLCQYQTLDEFPELAVRHYDWFEDLTFGLTVATLRDETRENSLFLYSRTSSYDDVFADRLDNCNLLDDAQARPLRRIGIYALPAAPDADGWDKLAGDHDYALDITLEPR